MKSNDAGKICVVIDLDETLVHSSFKVGLAKWPNFFVGVDIVGFTGLLSDLKQK